MFCPSCGTETREAIKFCKKCGTNLKRVQGVLGKGGAGSSANQSTDWNQWWIEEHQEKREQNKKKLPEEKRLEEVKAGIITASIGLAITIFLNHFLGAIAGTVDGPESGILRNIWPVGLIPFFIGLAITFNGLFISKRIVELKKQRELPPPQPLFTSVPNTSPVQQLTEASAQPISEFSIVEPTTTKLRDPISVPAHKTD
mgnify:CR=1 FL=1|jgi:hypothetical protein